MKTETKIGFWNIRTLNGPGKLRQVINEIQRYKVDIAGLSEIRWKQSGTFETLDRCYTLLYSGVPEDHDRVSGVGLILNKMAKKSLMEWHPVSDRVIMARFKSKIRNVTIVQCYAPTENAERSVKLAFYSELKQTLSRVNRRDKVIVMGDLNAKVGSNNIEMQHVMGPHGIGEINENGEMFVEFCSDHELVIGGTLFPHKKCHKTSWISPDGQTENQIDHFAISRSWRRALLDVRNKRVADVGSDHHLMLARIRIKILAHQSNFQNVQRKYYDTRKIKVKETRERIKKEIDKECESMHARAGESNNVESLWEEVKRVLLDVSERVIGYKKWKQKEWMSYDTWEKIEQRKNIKQQINSCRTRGRKRDLMQEYNAMDKEVKRSARRDKREWINELAAKAEEASNKGDMKELYHITRILSGRKNQKIGQVRNKEGQLLTTEDEQMRRWEEFYREILNRDTQNDREQNDIEQVPENDGEEGSYQQVEISEAAPTLPEIITALKQIKNGKAPGKDGVCPEILTVNINTTGQLMLKLFQQVWEEERVPKDWKTGLIVKIPKKGDLTKCNNWRGISLLSVPGKVFSRVILNRMELALEQRIRKEQAGFRRNRSCIDQINTLRLIIEQTAEWNTTLYLTFIDFEQAFDSLRHKAIWQVLRKYGVPSKIVDVIKDMYRDYNCQIIHNGKLSNPIPVTNGVRQGCILSPLLFLLVVDDIMRKVTGEKKRGLRWNLCDVLEDLDYADDICLLAARYVDAQQKLWHLQQEAATTGLKVNIKKTKDLRIKPKTQKTLEIEGEELERVTAFVYLGSTVTDSGGTLEDVRSRISKANAAFIQLNPVWRSKYLSIRTKLNIFTTNVKAVLLYGSETWLADKCIKHKLQTFVNRCLRKIFMIFWPLTIRNEALLELAGEDPIEKQIQRRKWRWIGHTLRKPADSIERQALEWNPQGQRRVGRPRGSWRRTVQKEVESYGRSWNEIKPMAANRVRWKKFTEALCSMKERKD